MGNICTSDTRSLEDQTMELNFDPALVDLWMDDMKGEIPLYFFERVFKLEPSDQHIVDLFMLLRIAQNCGHDVKFAEALREACNNEKANQIHSKDKPDFVRYRSAFQDAEDLFEREAFSKNERKGVTLQQVSNDFIPQKDDEEEDYDEKNAFLKRRVDEAYSMRKDFEKDLKVMAETFFGNYNPIVVVNAKSYERAFEKCHQSGREYREKGQLAQDYIYDLLRSQICLKPEFLAKDSIEETMEKIMEFLKSLVKEGTFIRVKNKLASLGQLLVNFVYKTQIVEVQIVFATSLKALKQSHTVYDLDRLRNNDDVLYFLKDKKEVKYYTRTFQEIGVRTFGKSLDSIGKKKGSLTFVCFACFAFGRPHGYDFPIFQKDLDATFNDFEPKKLIMDYKGHMEGKAKCKLSDGVYEGDWRNLSMHGEGVYTYNNGDKYEGGWSSGLRHGKGILYTNGEKKEGYWKNGEYLGEEEPQENDRWS